MYYRQIHPDAVSGSALNTLAFKPSEADNAVSTFDGNQISAQTSYNYWVNDMKKKSVGVVALIDDELKGFSIDFPFDGNKITVTCAISVDINGKPIPSHTNLIYPEYINKHQVKAIQRYLCKKASERGWIYKTEEALDLVAA